jgi:ribosome-associated translation inhibitor RaiA
MHIRVSGPAGLVTDQMRAYAEYRLFAALARFGRTVRQATVSLSAANSGEPGVICLVEVDLGPDGHVRARARQRYAAPAVEQAADLAKSALERRSKPVASQ